MLIISLRRANYIDPFTNWSVFNNFANCFW
jgi:hypothetical protein